MVFLREFRRKQKEKVLKKLDRELEETFKDVAIQSKLLAKRQEIEGVRNKVPQTKNRYLESLKSIGKEVYSKRQEYGRSAAIMGGNLLGQPYTIPKAPTTKKKIVNKGKRKIFIYDPNLKGYVERR
jgi:hypothetical protein